MGYLVELTPAKRLVFIVQRNDVNIPGARNRWYDERNLFAQLTAEEGLQIMRGWRIAMSNVIQWRVAAYEVSPDGKVAFVHAFTRKPRGY
jgi:hypothetical protein